MGLARRILLTLICVVVVFAIAAFGLMRQRIGDSDNSKEGTAMFTVDCGDLVISVTESGYIKAVKGPLPQVPLVPTGGVELGNVADFLNAGAAAVAVGGNLVSKKLIAARDFKGLTENAKAFAGEVRAVHP